MSKKCGLIFLVEGMSGGFSDYREEFSDLIDAIEAYKRLGYADCPSFGSFSVIVKTEFCCFTILLR